MARIRWRRLGLALLAGLALIGLLEAGLRACAPERFGPQPLVVWELTSGATGRDLHQPARALWEPRPGVVDPWGDRLDPDGFRGPPRPPDPRRVQILALGDSSTYGFEVREEEAWPRRLEARLRMLGHDVDVVNAGVIGYTAAQGEARYEELRTRYAPRLVFLAFGATNEHQEAPQGTTDLQKIALWDRQNQLAARVWRESAVARLAASLGEALGLRRPPAEIGETRSRRNEWGAIDFDGVRRMPPAEFERTLERLCARIRGDGATPILVSMPRRAEFEVRRPILPVYSRAVESVARRLDVPLLDARMVFRGFREGRLFLAGDNVHPTTTGHDLLAALAARLAEPLLAEPAGGGR